MSFSLGRWSLRRDKSTAQPPPTQPQYLPQYPHHPLSSPHPNNYPPYSHPLPQFHHYPPQSYNQPYPQSHPQHPPASTASPAPLTPYNPALASTVPTGLQFHHQSHIQPPSLPPRPTSFIGYQSPPSPSPPQAQNVPSIQPPISAGEMPPTAYLAVDLANSLNVSGTPSAVSSVSQTPISYVPSPASTQSSYVQRPITRVPVPTLTPFMASASNMTTESVPTIAPRPLSIPPPPLLTAAPMASTSTPYASILAPALAATAAAPEPPIPVDIEALDPTSTVRSPITMNPYDSSEKIPVATISPAAPTSSSSTSGDNPKMYAVFNNYVDDFSVWRDTDQTGEERSDTDKRVPLKPPRPTAVTRDAAAAPEVVATRASAPVLPEVEIAMKSVYDPAKQLVSPVVSSLPITPATATLGMPVSSETLEKHTYTSAPPVMPTPPVSLLVDQQMASLTSAMANTKITTPSTPSTLSPATFQLLNTTMWGPDDATYTPPRFIRYSGTPDAVNYNCMGPGISSFIAKYYWHPAAPRFRICANCFQRLLSKTPFAGQFTSGSMGSGSCFMSRSVEKYLLPQKISSGDFTPVLAFMQMRSMLPDCARKDCVPKNNGYTWYRVQPSFASPGTNISKFSICGACHADEILHSPWAHKFEPKPMPQDDLVACDFLSPYLQRTFRKAMTANNWAALDPAIGKRGPLGLCPSQTERGTPGWRTTNQTCPSLLICPVCYYEYFAETPFDGYVHEIPASYHPKELECTFKDHIPALMAIGLAIDQRDINIFLRAGPAIGSRPCRGSVYNGGQFYKLPGLNNIDCCEACFLGIMAPSGLGNYFSATNYPFGTQVQCDFSLARPQGLKIFHGWLAAYMFGVATPMIKLLEGGQSPVAYCPGLKLNENQYYGWSPHFPDIAICTSCYDNVVKGTVLDKTIDVHAVKTKTTCCMATHRQKSFFAKACAESDLAAFMAIAVQRNKIEIAMMKYRMEMENRLVMMKFQANMHATACMSSVVYGAAAGLEAINKHDNYIYGSTETGWHDTIQGVTAAQYANQTNEYAANVNGMFGNMLMTARSGEDLEKLWNLVC